jgi:hypothetical protein
MKTKRKGVRGRKRRSYGIRKLRLENDGGASYTCCGDKELEDAENYVSQNDNMRRKSQLGPITISYCKGLGNRVVPLPCPWSSELPYLRDSQSAPLLSTSSSFSAFNDFLASVVRKYSGRCWKDIVRFTLGDKGDEYQDVEPCSGIRPQH